MTAAQLSPFPVAGPLAVAGVLLAVGKLLPRNVPDMVAILTALVAAAICAMLAVDVAAHGPLTYWFGGWTPRDGQALGISFRVDMAGTGAAAFICALFATALTFAWGYYKEVHAHFHVLMLLFMAGMVGFCLTADVFNMFVWFEMMSVAAFALTGYQLKASPLEGAINFTVVSTIGSYLFLGGVALLYSVAGSLDMAQIAARGPPGPALSAAFVLMASAMLIKAAQIPFHLWLPDAHGVAPSPVSVIFSGAMVTMGVFGLLRLVSTVFAGSADVHAALHTLLLGMGVGSAAVGGAMALLQRHVKRMLAFSTVSHTGLLLVGLALADHGGVAGLLVYGVGHGLVKATLFMVAGILLASCGGIDEIGLRGLGRPIWPAGLVMAAGGLLLAGLPVGLMDDGFALLSGVARAAGRGWVVPVMVFGAATTGGAVLRAAGRIFAGLGPSAGEEAHSPTVEEREKAGRPLPLLLACAVVPLAVALIAAQSLDGPAVRAAAQLGMPGPGIPVRAGVEAWVGVAMALAVAMLDLFRNDVPERVAVLQRALTGPVARGLVFLHAGAVGDYVAWLAVGLALLAGAVVLL